MPTFNKFGKTYLKQGRKRKVDEIVIEGTPPPAKRRKTVVYEVPDNSPAWNMPLPSGNASGLYNISVNSKEYKFMDTSLGVTGTPIVLTGTLQFFLLNGLKLGTNAFSRIGNKIAMKSLYWSVAFGLASADGDPATTTNINNVPVRFMIVYDKQANGAVFLGSDLLNAFSGVDNTTARSLDVNSPNNLNNKDRFVVVADKRFVLNTGGPSARYIKKYKRLNTSVAYKSGATAGDITDITSGSMYAIVWRDNDLNGVTNPTVAVGMTGDIRLRYLDD